MMESRSPPGTMVVTGASGWLGRALLARLTERRAVEMHPGCRVRALVRHPVEIPTMPSTATGRLELVAGEITDASMLDRLLRGVPPIDLIHCAGVIHPRRMHEFECINVGGTAAVIAAARRAGVRRMVHVSSNSPFGVNPTSTDAFRDEEPFNPYMGYGSSKMHAEIAVRAANGYELETVIVRPPWFYGPYQPARQTQFLRALRRGRFPLVGDARNKRSMVFIDNLADGLICAVLANHAAGHAYWIADRRPYEMREIAETTRRAMDREGLAVSDSMPRVPRVFGDWAARADALLQRRGCYVSELHVLGEMNETIVCDISRAQRELGYEPRVELYEGMRRSIRWCLEQGIDL